MAKSTNVVDQSALYNAAYNQGLDAENATKDYRNDLTERLVLKAGQWVVGKYQQSFQELKGLKQLGRKSKNALELEMASISNEFNPEIQASLDQWKKEYDKGARMSVRGLTRSKKDEGERMMQLAWQKMQTFDKELNLVETGMQENLDNGMKELGEKPTEAELSGWNSGATWSQFNNATRLANGTMLQELYVNPETGEIMRDTQETADTSDEAYQAYSNELLNAGQQPLEQEDWAVSQQDQIEITSELFRDLDLPGAEDPKLQAGIGALYKSSDEGGRNGIELDDQTRNRMQMELDDQFNSASDLQIRSFMFGGTITIVGDNGSLMRVKPAYKYLIDNEIPPGDGSAPDGSPEHNQYLKFQAALENLKESDFSKRGGSDMREKLIKMVADSAEEYHQNGYDIYMDKQALADEKSRRNSKPEKIEDYYQTPGVGNGYSDKKLANTFVNHIKNTTKKVKDLFGATWSWNSGEQAYEAVNEDGDTVYRTKSDMLFENGMADIFSTLYSDYDKSDTKATRARRNREIEEERKKQRELDGGSNTNPVDEPGFNDNSLTPDELEIINKNKSNKDKMINPDNIT